MPLWRELSAQHFKGGSWAPGAHRPPPGAPCQCEQLDARTADGYGERTTHNQNVQFNRLARLKTTTHGVGLVPFFNLTAPRHAMHRRHFCSYSNQLKVGRCCDCTHLCYTPLFWDAFFGGLHHAVRRAQRRASAELEAETATSTGRRRTLRAGRAAVGLRARRVGPAGLA